MGSRQIMAAGVIAASVAWVVPASAQWQIESKDGKASLKFGILVQGQTEMLETADHAETSTNLYLRRFRVLFGGAINERWSFFFETDSPNLGKGNPNPGPTSGAKDAGDVFIQDAFVTYTHREAFKIDAGLIMPPVSRNGTQSAASLLAVDYGPYSFVHSGPITSRVGRDYGLQVRGYPAKQHLEYRLAVTQGLRGTEATNPLRISGRVVYYPFGAETGFFYAGTFQGTKKQVGFGGSFDIQDDHRIYAADVFAELPLAARREGVTLQANWMHYDGGAFLTAVPEQDTILVEGGYHLFNRRVTPFVQYHARRFADDITPDQDQAMVGVAYWMAGHQRNVKLAVGRLHIEGQDDRTLAVLQLQIFYF